MEGANVLVVEDEALIRITAMQIVEDAGYSVVEAANADEAIEMLERCSAIETVITDINMPGKMNGLELARVINERWPQIEMIITSARLFSQIPDGAQFIAKPYTSDEIVGALRLHAF